MLQSLRIKLIKWLIDINEYCFFERRLKKTYKSLIGNNFKIIVDVGANKGQTIDFFKKIKKECKIYAFEPNKNLADQLIIKYHNDETIKILNIGISDKAGKREFHQNVLDYTSSFEELNLNSSYLQNKARILGVKPEEIITASYQVETTTLFDFINAHINQTIDVLKIDVEGHEYPCLIGLFYTGKPVNIRYIQIEQHNDDMHVNKIPFENIKKLLNDNGFIVKSIIKHGFGNLDEVIFSNTNLKFNT
jgi:FkbM family methyltransferase